MTDRKLLTALALLIFSSPFFLSVSGAQEAAHHWEFAGWHGGGCYPNVEFDPNIKNRVYLTSDVAGIWRSDDLGEHWNFINRGLEKLNVPLIAVAPSDSNVLYAGTTAGLYRSHNAGESWEPRDTDGGRIRFERPASYRSIAVSQKNADELAVGTAGGEVLFSKDGGLTWNTLGGLRAPLGQGQPISALLWSQDGSKLYAASKSGFSSYSLAEQKWVKPAGPPKAITDLLAVGDRLYAAGQESLFISEDGGGSWSASAKVPSGTTFRVTAVPSGDKTRLLAVWAQGWHGEVVESADDGLSWTPATLRMDADKTLDPTRQWAGFTGEVKALKVDPFDPNILFRTDSWGVWRSDDGGRNWAEKINGAPNTVGSDVVVTEDGTVYAATMDNGLLKSVDGGKNYETLFPSKGYHNDINGHVWRILAAGGGNIIATSSPWNKGVNQIILSSDGGKNFDILTEGLPPRRPRTNTMWWEGFPRAIAVDPKDPNTLYLGIDGDDGGGFFVSNDGGRHWRYPKAQPRSKRVYNALAVDPTDTNRIFWGTYGKGGGIYVSEDKGNSWKLVFHEMSLVFDIALAADGTVYAAGEKDGACLYVSRDHGKTWGLLKKFSQQGSVEALCLLSDDGKKIALSSHQWSEWADGKVHYSKDGGATWTDITGDLPPGSGMAALAYDRKSGHLYGIRYAGSVYKLNLGMVE